MTVNGLLATYEAKVWAVTNGLPVSAGTVGAERLWRNRQRRARNKARSRADPATVNMSEFRTKMKRSTRVVCWVQLESKSPLRLMALHHQFNDIIFV